MNIFFFILWAQDANDRSDQMAAAASSLMDANELVFGLTEKPYFEPQQQQTTTTSSGGDSDFMTAEERRRFRREKDRRRRHRAKKAPAAAAASAGLCLRNFTNDCLDPECKRSHEFRRPRQLEPCHHYFGKSGICTAGNLCNFMHADWPCAFYACGVKSRKHDTATCRGKHANAPLSPELKTALLAYIESGQSGLPDSAKDRAAELLEIREKRFETKRPPMAVAAASSTAIAVAASVVPFPSSSSSATPPPTTSTNDTYLIKHALGIISDDQLERLQQLGVHHLQEVDHLSSHHLHSDVCLTARQLEEIQKLVKQKTFDIFMSVLWKPSSESAPTTPNSTSELERKNIYIA